MPNDFDVVEYTTGKSGPHLLVLGGVHGNEPCGVEALDNLVGQLKTGRLSLTRGKLTIAPLCNPAAWEHNTRFVDVNLNRIIGATTIASTSVEYQFAKQIADLIENADFVLDLHSYTSGDKPFLFLDYHDKTTVAFAKALRISNWITGWPELYQSDGIGLSQGDTGTYAHSCGKTSIVVECGTHADPLAVQVGINSVYRALTHLGMVLPPTEIEPIVPPVICRVTTIVTRDREGVFTKNWQHLDSVSKGEPLVLLDNGSVIASPYKGFVILPDKDALLGSEWLYLGVPRTPR